MITLLIIVAIGLILSKEFRTGLINMIGAAIVFTPVILVGLVYSMGHAFYMWGKSRSITVFLMLLWRLLDGTYAVIGDTMKYGFAYRYDELANVWGEWLEDSVTTEEETSLGDRQTTVSASIGFLEYHKLPLFKSGKWLSKALNFVFRQTRHAIGSWEKKLALKELEDKNLHGNKIKINL